MVIILLPNCGSCQSYISDRSPQNKNCRYQRQGAQHKRDRQQFRHAEQPQLRVGGLHQHHRGGQQQKLRDEQDQAEQSARLPPTRAQTEREKHVHQQRHQHQLLHRRAPLDQRQVRSGVFENHGLVDHREFQVRGGIVHGNAAGFRDQDDEERGKCQHLRRRQETPALSQRRVRHGAQVGGARADRHRENGQHQRGLGDGGDRHLPAAAQAAERNCRCPTRPSARKKRPSARR